MDLDHLDHLARSLASSSSRRRLIGFLGAVPALGGLLNIVDPEQMEAKDRRRRRKQRHKKRKSHGSRKKGCTPRSKATICAGTCGTVKNRQTCGKSVDCGSCACNPACGVCFTCQDFGANAPGTCVVDPAQQGESCGSDGQICQTNGTCACDIGSCSNPTPICTNGACAACTAHAECGDGFLCLDDGRCQTCDVCLTGDCAFNSIQAAISATPQLATVYVCPGTYIDNHDTSNAVFIDHSLELVGAGDGTDEDTNTILQPDHARQVVVRILPPSGQPDVTLQSLHIAGRSGIASVGMSADRSVVQVVNCTISGNLARDDGGLAGGMVVGTDGDVTLINTRIEGNSGSSAGGVELQAAGICHLTLDALSRITGNTGSFGGIRALAPCVVELQSADNVTGNTSVGSAPNCGGDGTFTGPGAVCTNA